jgi:hypothetical protein
MSWGKWASILAVVGFLVGGAWHVRGEREEIHGKIRSNQEVIQSNKDVIDQLVELQKQEQLERIKHEAERKVIRDMCAQGRLSTEECK